MAGVLAIIPTEPLKPGLYLIDQSFEFALKHAVLLAVGPENNASHAQCINIRKQDNDLSVPVHETCDRRQAGDKQVAPLRQTIADIIRDSLDIRFPGWRIEKLESEKDFTCFDKESGFQPFFVWGDFTGDGRLDYAVKFYEGDQEHTLVFLGNADGSLQVYALEQRTSIGQGDAGYDLLSLAKKGTKYYDHGRKEGGTFLNDTPVKESCGQGSAAYVFENGKFRKVIISD